MYKIYYNNYRNDELQATDMVQSSVKSGEIKVPKNKESHQKEKVDCIGRIKIIVKLVVFFFLVFVLASYFSGIYRIDKSTKNLEERVSQSEVLFFGTSGFNRAISPMRLYDQEGITSFNLANQWEQIPLNYYTIREYAKPGRTKLVVLDVETFFDSDLQTLDTAHYSVDKMPLDAEKLRFINDPVWGMDLGEKIGFVVPMIRYHDRWSEVGLPNYLTTKRALCDDWQCYGYMYDDKTFQEEKLKYTIGLDYETNHALEYVLKIKNYCNTNGIELLLLLPPWQRFNEEHYALLEKIFEENGLKYENFKSENAKMFDNEKDFSNSGHLNTAGAVKYSDFLGNYLKKNYNLNDYRSNANYEKWQSDLGVYSEKEKNVLEQHAKNVKEIRRSKKKTIETEDGNEKDTD